MTVKNEINNSFSNFINRYDNSDEAIQQSERRNEFIKNFFNKETNSIEIIYNYINSSQKNIK